jgi:hypothetical protein
VRAAIIGVTLAAIVFAARARAQDDPSCARYDEPMAYNACLASHGPKASDLGMHPGQMRHGDAYPGRARDSQSRTSAAPGRRWQRAQPSHGRVHMEFRVR